MVPYLIFVFLILIFRYASKPKYMYVTMLLFNVLRYDTGWDYMNYYNEALYWGAEGSSTARYSFIWQWLFGLANKLNMPHLVMVIVGVLTISIVYFAVFNILKSKKSVCDALCIYSLWPFFYLGTFSTIRQSLGISIGLLLVLCAMRRKYVFFFLLLVLNFFIHPSSVVCIAFAVFFFPDFRLKMWKMVVIIIAVFVVMLSIEALIQNSPLAAYQIYLGHSDSYGSKLSILLAFILIPTLRLRYKKIGNQGMTDVCIMSIILLICTLVSFNNTVLSRITEYYVILLIFVGTNYKQLFSDKTFGNTIIYSLFAGVFLFYLYNTQGAAAVQQGLATSPFVPYQFIFAQ